MTHKLLRWMDDPAIMTRFKRWSLLLWTVMVPVTLLTQLKDSVPWISFLSVWALAEGSWAALQAAHAEREQDKKLDIIIRQNSLIIVMLRRGCDGLPKTEAERKGKGNGNNG